MVNIVAMRVMQAKKAHVRKMTLKTSDASKTLQFKTKTMHSARKTINVRRILRQVASQPYNRRGELVIAIAA